MNLTEQIIRNGPNATVEFIASLADVAAILESVVALLNSGGGYVVVGVDRTGRVLGIADAHPAAAALQTQLVQAISPTPSVEVGIDAAAGQQVIMVVVPGSKDAPFMTGGCSFVRRGAASVVASGHELQAMLQKRMAEAERWERQISSLEEEDLDLKEVAAGLQAVLQYEVVRPPFAAANELLPALGMVQRGQLRNAADICFGKNPALRHAQTRVRCFAFETDRSGNLLAQRTLAGPVVSVLEQALTFVWEQVPSANAVKDHPLGRAAAAPYPLLALREGLVNALAHRDYASFSGGVTLEIYPTRLEIWNSGRLPPNWDAHRLGTAHLALPTNPDIAHYLYVRGYMERIGRGTLKIIQACKAARIPSPQWVADEHGVRLTLRPRLVKVASPAQLNQRQRTFLRDLEAGGVVSFADYRRVITDVGERQARRDVSRLAALGFLQPEGKGSFRYYVRTKRELA